MNNFSLSLKATESLMSPTKSQASLKSKRSNSTIESPPKEPVKFKDLRKRIVDFKELKYNLDDLFNNTPIFDIPWLDYAENHSEKSWAVIAKAIFDPFGKINEYVQRIK